MLGEEAIVGEGRPLTADKRIIGTDEYGPATESTDHNSHKPFIKFMTICRKQCMERGQRGRGTVCGCEDIPLRTRGRQDVRMSGCSVVRMPPTARQCFDLQQHTMPTSIHQPSSLGVIYEGEITTK